MNKKAAIAGLIAMAAASCERQAPRISTVKGDRTIQIDGNHFVFGAGVAGSFLHCGLHSTKTDESAVCQWRGAGVPASVSVPKERHLRSWVPAVKLGAVITDEEDPKTGYHIWRTSLLHQDGSIAFASEVTSVGALYSIADGAKRVVLAGSDSTGVHGIVVSDGIVTQFGLPVVGVVASGPAGLLDGGSTFVSWSMDSAAPTITYPMTCRVDSNATNSDDTHVGGTCIGKSVNSAWWWSSPATQYSLITLKSNKNARAITFLGDRTVVVWDDSQLQSLEWGVYRTNDGTQLGTLRREYSSFGLSSNSTVFPVSIWADGQALWTSIDEWSAKGATATLVGIPCEVLLGPGAAGCSPVN